MRRRASRPCRSPSRTPAAAAGRGSGPASAQPRFELYGFVMLDGPSTTRAARPHLVDVLRPTKLPASYENEYGENGHFFFGVQQSRIGIKPHVPTDGGRDQAQFDIDFFGVGVDAGQTTIRLRHAYGKHRRSSGSARPRARSWTPTCSRTRSSTGARTAWSSSGTSSSGGRRCPGTARCSRWSAREPAGTKASTPTVSNSTTCGSASRCPTSPPRSVGRQDWGYVRVAGILRYIKWDDIGAKQFDLSGDAVGWGVNASTNVNLGKRTWSAGRSPTARASRTT